MREEKDALQENAPDHQGSHAHRHPEPAVLHVDALAGLSPGIWFKFQSCHLICK